MKFVKYTLSSNLNKSIEELKQESKSYSSKIKEKENFTENDLQYLRTLEINNQWIRDIDKKLSTERLIKIKGPTNKFYPIEVIIVN